MAVTYTGGQVRPVALTSGILYGPEPDGTELDAENVNDHDWLWTASELTMPTRGNDAALEVTQAGGRHAWLDTSAARRLEGPAGLWLVSSWQLFAGHEEQAYRAFVRTLLILPD